MVNEVRKEKESWPDLFQTLSNAECQLHETGMKRKMTRSGSRSFFTTFVALVTNVAQRTPDVLQVGHMQEDKYLHTCRVAIHSALPETINITL